jgi:hypothetical protein
MNVSLSLSPINAKSELHGEVFFGTEPRCSSRSPPRIRRRSSSCDWRMAELPMSVFVGETGSPLKPFKYLCIWSNFKD